MFRLQVVAWIVDAQRTLTSYPSEHTAVYSCMLTSELALTRSACGRFSQVGVGTNPPCRPHHRAASCGPSRVPCDCTALYNKGCNPNTLYGALVGGPNKEGKFEDLRTDFAAAEVTLDWNAALTGMVAGLTGNRITWDDCKSAGLQEKPGDIAPALSAGSATRAAAIWRLLLCIAAIALAAAGWA